MIVCVQFVTALAQNEFKFFSMLYAESRLEGQRFIALLTSPCTVHLSPSSPVPTENFSHHFWHRCQSTMTTTFPGQPG